MAGELILPEVATPSTPASSKQAIYATNAAGTGKVVIAHKDSAGLIVPLLEPIFTSNVADFTLANSASAQSPFEAARDTLTVVASTTYLMEGLVQLTGMGATTRTTALEFDAGSATFTAISYFGEIYTGAAQTIPTASGQKHCIAATAQILNATVATAAATIKWRGLVRINGAGTFIPQIKFSADPTGTLISEQDSYFMMIPLGLNTLGSIGSWA